MPSSKRGNGSMVFIDGTNLFRRLHTAHLKLRSLTGIIRHCEPEREVVRAYLYTTKPKFDTALTTHGPILTGSIRVVYGDSVETADGPRGKGVDALLVADMVYRAAVRNYERAVLISADQVVELDVKTLIENKYATALPPVASAT